VDLEVASESRLVAHHPYLVDVIVPMLRMWARVAHAERAERIRTRSQDRLPIEHTVALAGPGGSDRKPYLAALVTLDPEALETVAEQAGVPQGDLATLAARPEVAAWVQAQIEEVCNRKVSRVQTVKRARMLPVEFSVDSGELTPTLKLKRNVVGDRYADEIEALYAEGASA